MTGQHLTDTTHAGDIDASSTRHLVLALLAGTAEATVADAAHTQGRRPSAQA